MKFETWQILPPITPDKAIIQTAGGDRRLVVRRHSGLYTVLGYDDRDALREVIVVFDRQTGCAHPGAEDLAAQIEGDMKRGKGTLEALRRADVYGCCEPVWHDGGAYPAINVAWMVAYNAVLASNLKHGDILNWVIDAGIARLPQIYAEKGDVRPDEP